MSLLSLESFSPGLATNCVFIGSGNKADCIWTRDDFRTICEHMLNGNPTTDFLLVYRNRQERPSFAKAKNAQAGRRASWAWETITGRAKSKVGIGFYPSNKDGTSRWAAMDFDAHAGEALRARGLAIAAFEVLRRNPQMYLVLGTSGSEGWHLFVFTHDFHPVAEWTLLLKGVATVVGAEVKPGVCEIFPNEHKKGALPYGIRAPGTWNPKTDALGLIAFSSVKPLLDEGKEKKKEYPFLYRATNRVNSGQLHDSEKDELYRGSKGEWRTLFAVTQPCTRRNQLKEMVHHVFRQVGVKVARLNAEAQYRESDPIPRATFDEHLAEFEDLWLWINQQWHMELAEEERARFDALGTGTDQELFRILFNFARKAEMDDLPDFPFPVQHVGARLGVTYQNVCKMRNRFVALGIILKTAGPVVNRAAARFRWLPPTASAAADPF